MSSRARLFDRERARIPHFAGGRLPRHPNIPETIARKFMENEQVSSLYDPEEENRKLARRVRELEMIVARIPLNVGILKIRNVTSNEAEDMIEDYMAKNERAFPSDIAESLGISLRTTVEALQRLKDAGVVK